MMELGDSKWHASCGPCRKTTRRPGTCSMQSPEAGGLTIDRPRLRPYVEHEQAAADLGAAFVIFSRDRGGACRRAGDAGKEGLESETRSAARGVLDAARRLHLGERGLNKRTQTGSDFSRILRDCENDRVLNPDSGRPAARRVPGVDLNRVIYFAAGSRIEDPHASALLVARRQGLDPAQSIDIETRDIIGEVGLVGDMDADHVAIADTLRR